MTIRRTTTAILAVAGLTAIPAVAISSASSAQPRAHTAAATVTIKGFAFSPTTVTIKRGGSVKWTWRDAPIGHDVTSKGAKKFSKLAQRTSGSASRTFKTAGTYSYICSIHPTLMKGKIVVK